MYHTFARTKLDPGIMTKEIVEIIKKFKWSIVGVMWENIPGWTKHKETLVEALKENNITVSITRSFISVKKYTPKKHKQLFRNTLNVLKGKARGKCLLSRDVATGGDTPSWPLLLPAVVSGGDTPSWPLLLPAVVSGEDTPSWPLLLPAVVSGGDTPSRPLLLPAVVSGEIHPPGCYS